MDILTFGIVIFSLIFLTIQIKKQKVSLRTLVWPYMMLIAMFIIMYPPLLRLLTTILGFQNTENLIFFIVCGYLFVITIVHEIRIAKLNDKVNNLSRQVAINSEETNDNNSNN